MAFSADVDPVEKHYLQAELEEQMGGSSALFDLLCHGTVDGIWYWNLQKPEDEWMSPEFWRLFGVDPATKRHDPIEWQDLIFPDDGEVALDNFHKHCADPSHPYDQVVRYRHADGSTVWVRCRGVALRDDDGTPIRMLGAHTDLTDLMNAKDELNEANNRLRSANRTLERNVRTIEAANSELTEFAYAASHDLKAPINTLRLLSEEVAYELGPDHDVTRTLIEPGLKVADRARSLVEDILHYTRVIGDEWVVEPIDLDALVADVVADLAAEFRGAEVTVEPLPTIHGDPVQIRVLISNLITNALKFRVDGGERHQVRVRSVEPADGTVGFAVSDTGIGMASDDVDHIFELFKRMNLASEYEGTGLGLSLCRRVALNHQGSITVESVVGEGSTFTVRLPEGGPSV